MSTLKERLDRIKEGFVKQAPAEAVALMSRATEDLRAYGILDGGRGVLAAALASIGVMVFSLSGCAHDKKKINKGLSAENRPGAEIERLGDVYFNQGNLELALIEYNKFLNLNPDDIRVLYKKGRVLLRGKADEPAIREFDKVIKIKSSYIMNSC